LCLDWKLFLPAGAGAAQVTVSRQRRWAGCWLRHGEAAAASTFIFKPYLYCSFLLPCWERRNAPLSGGLLAARPVPGRGEADAPCRQHLRHPLQPQGWGQGRCWGDAEPVRHAPTMGAGCYVGCSGKGEVPASLSSQLSTSGVCSALAFGQGLYYRFLTQQ